MSKRALRIVLGDRPIAYHPIIARVMGDAASGIWLSQLLYWDSVKVLSAEEKSEEWDGWFYKSEPEIIGETALSRRECQSAKATAKELAIIQTQVKGSPPTSHYKIDFDILEVKIEQVFQSRNGVRLTAQRQAIKRAPSRDQSVHIPLSDSDRLPESTTKITTETSTSTALPENCFKVYENEIGLLTPHMTEELKDAEKDFPPDWIIDSLHICGEQNKRNWSYARAILTRWKAEGRASAKPTKQNGNGHNGNGHGAAKESYIDVMARGFALADEMREKREARG